MRFEHLIEINPPDLGLTLAFTREELWRGLLVRVFEPEAFPLGPDTSHWQEEAAGPVADTALAEPARPAGALRLRRHLRFGAVELADRVQVQAMQGMVFTPDERPDATPVVLTLTLEEPHAGMLWLRFVYESVRPLTVEEAFYDGFRRSAWLENDRDMVRTLRTWLAQGRLAAS